MLGSEVLAVRLGGIYALQSLAMEDPEQYITSILHVLSAFENSPTGAIPLEKTKEREDIQASEMARNIIVRPKA